MFDEEDISLLEGLTEEELEQLSFTVDPEQSLLDASERCSYKKSQPETRMYEREHLMDFMEKLAGSKVPKTTYIPHKKKEIEPPPPIRRPSPLPHVQLSTEEAEELDQMTETELIELAAYIGATNLLTQDQIHAVELGKKPEGTAFARRTVVKSSIPTSNVPMDPEQDLDVITLKKCLKEGNVKVITINNIPELEGDVFDEILMSLDENSALTHLSLANTGMSDKVAKSFVDSIECNTVLETLNLESNYIAPGTLLELVKAAGQSKSLRELSIANQKMRLGAKYEEKIANVLESNHCLLRIGLTIENAGPRNKIDRFLIRNNDQLRRARQEGKQTYNFNNVKATIKNAKQPWLKQRGIFQKGEIKLASNDEEDGTAEPMSRLKKTGYNYEKERERPIVNLYEEEGITAEEAAQVYQQQMMEGLEKQAKQSDMLGELTQKLAKRNSRLAAAASENEGESEERPISPVSPELRPPTLQKQPAPISPQRELQMSMQAEMAAALEERQRKIIQEGEKAEEEDAELEERRRRRRGRGRRRGNEDNDDQDGGSKKEEANQENDEARNVLEEIGVADESKKNADESQDQGSQRRRRQRQRYPSDDDEKIAVTEEADGDKSTENKTEIENDSGTADENKTVVKDNTVNAEGTEENNEVSTEKKTEQVPLDSNAGDDKAAEIQNKSSIQIDGSNDSKIAQPEKDETTQRRKQRRQNAVDEESQDEEHSIRKESNKEEDNEEESRVDRAERRRKLREARETDSDRPSRRSRRNREESTKVENEGDQNNNEDLTKTYPVEEKPSPTKDEAEPVSIKDIPPKTSINDELDRPMSLRERRRLREMAGQ